MDATLELKRSNLVLPSSGYELDREEMSYVDGGLNIPRGVIGGAVDLLLSVAGINAAFLGVKIFGKKAAANFLTGMGVTLINTATTAIKALAGGLSLSVNLFIGSLGNFLLGNLWILTSPGNAIAGFFDFIDGYFGGKALDGYVTL